jgi:hypothetical protein
MESRMATTASTLFRYYSWTLRNQHGNNHLLCSGNVSNFLLSMQDAEKKWHVNLEDPAVRSCLVAYQGKKLDPYMPPAPAVSAKPVKPEVNPAGMISLLSN